MSIEVFKTIDQSMRCLIKMSHRIESTTQNMMQSTNFCDQLLRTTKATSKYL